MRIVRIGAVCAVVCALTTTPALASLDCPAERDSALGPTDPELCASLDRAIRAPRATSLDLYERQLGDYLRNFCHRNPAAGWLSDKALRDTGPYVATLADGKWTGTYYGTHAPVVIWYSPEMISWLRANRPSDAAQQPETPAPVPDGAVMVKEMFPAPAEACRNIDPARLLPTSGAAVMVRDAAASHDGWFWGWFGWSGWTPDWPAPADNAYPNMGFGQYCTNCHASARDNSTFASLNNIAGEPGTFLQFLSQYSFLHAQLGAGHAGPHFGSLHEDIANAAPLAASTAPILSMPSETYDNVWVPAHGGIAGEFVTSDQCLGCHSSGGTGLQFHMTTPAGGDKVVNLSPYGTWRTSPMGMAGRDPVFLAQLASEVQSFNPEAAVEIQDTCLGCHGLLGQRQFAINRRAATGRCEPFPRTALGAVPWPHGNPNESLANYGALARDGISCVGCHHMVLGKTAGEKYGDAPQNRCVLERQALLNPDETGLARTFTGSFLVGPPDEVSGPFEHPKAAPMLAALNVRPVADQNMLSSEICASCHTVHLKVLQHGKLLTRTYEQTTYPEWAFSDYRTGATPDGPLPSGAGGRAQSCQGCHMPAHNEDGTASTAKIANIQEYSSFPQVEHGLGPAEIDLEARTGFSRHTLVGLNIFFVKMMEKFPDVLGIRLADPMLTKRGIDSVITTERALLTQASDSTARIGIADIRQDDTALSATVSVENLAGHKFPSGVGFRRAFIQFRVLDAVGKELWASGRTDERGAIVDADGTPISGEYWWKEDCSARVNTTPPAFQPHYRTISGQDQAQIFQELVTPPPTTGPVRCGSHDATARNEATGALTTSFMSICGKVKDNRLLPHGFLDLDQRRAIATAIGAGPDLAEEVAPEGIGDDPAYRTGGGDSVRYLVETASLNGPPAFVEATLYYQAMPPYFLQDRKCTASGADTDRLSWIKDNLDLKGSPAEGWRLRIVATGLIPVGR